MKTLGLLKKPKGMILLFLILALPVTLMMTKQVQDLRQNAQQPIGSPTPEPMSPTPNQFSIACDLNGDKITNVNDFTTLYYCAIISASCTPKNRILADNNKNGVVDTADINRYSQSCVFNKPRVTLQPSGSAGSPTLQPSYMPRPTSNPVGGTITPTRSYAQPSPTISLITNYKIIGSVYLDTNKNGKKDWNEKGFSGVSLTVHTGSYKLVCSMKSSTNGSFICSVPSAGTYRINVTNSQNYTVSSTNPVVLTIPNSQTSTTVNFGLSQ